MKSDRGIAHVLQKREQDRLGRMVWSGGTATDDDTVGNVYYYYDPKYNNKEPVCAIKEGYWGYTVFWNGWGVSSFWDLEVLKKDVEQKHRIDTMKIFTWAK